MEGCTICTHHGRLEALSVLKCGLQSYCTPCMAILVTLDHCHNPAISARIPQRFDTTIRQALSRSQFLLSCRDQGPSTLLHQSKPWRSRLSWQTTTSSQVCHSLCTAIEVQASNASFGLDMLVFPIVKHRQCAGFNPFRSLMTGDTGAPGPLRPIPIDVIEKDDKFEIKVKKAASASRCSGAMDLAESRCVLPCHVTSPAGAEAALSVQADLPGQRQLQPLLLTPCVLAPTASDLWLYH